MRVNKLMPRVFFETVEDAMQAGAAAVRIATEEDSKAYHEFLDRLAEEEAPAEPEESEDPETKAAE